MSFVKTLRAAVLRATMGAAAMGAVLCTPATGYAATIENPSDEQFMSLYHFMAGDPPNFEDEARKDHRYRSANEFDKPAVLKQIVDQKRALYEGNAEIDLIRVRTGSSFGEYNPELGGYQFKIFAPGVYFPFGDFDRYGLTMENAADFRDWTLPVAQAKEMRNAEPYGRMVFEISIRPFGIAATREKRVRGQIVAVKAYLQQSNRLVYEASIPPSEYRAIAGADNPAVEKALDPAQITLQGVSLGIARAEFEAWLEQRGLLSKPARQQISFGTNKESVGLHNSSGQLQAVGNIDYDPMDAGVFGKDFDCRSVDDSLHSCGYARFDAEDRLVSMVVMQSAVGVTKQQIVSSLNQAYGSPSDRLNVFAKRAFRGEQYVWGLSSTALKRNTTDLTDVSGATHWQVEAVISEPSAKRIVVFVQINQIDAAGSNGDGSGGAVSGGGQIKF